MPLRRFRKHQRWSLHLAAFLLLFAQLAFATHSLHLKATPADDVCSFCVVGSHLETAPQIAELALPARFELPLAARVTHVCDSNFLLSPRLSRGPPQV